MFIDSLIDWCFAAWPGLLHVINGGRVSRKKEWWLAGVSISASNKYTLRFPRHKTRAQSASGFERRVSTVTGPNVRAPCIGQGSKGKLEPASCCCISHGPKWHSAPVFCCYISRGPNVTARQCLVVTLVMGQNVTASQRLVVRWVMGHMSHQRFVVTFAMSQMSQQASALLH